MINHVQLQGRLTADAQVFYSQKGTAVLSISLAWNSGAPDSKGTFVTCKMFGKVAEHYGTALKKGELVMVMGRLHTESYTGKDGKERNSLVVLIDAVIPSMIDISGGGTAPASSPPPRREPAAAPASATNVNEDDVPFSLLWWLGIGSLSIQAAHSLIS